MPKAMAMGNATSPTVRPAIRSEAKSPRWYAGRTVHSFGIQGDQEAGNREMREANNYLDYRSTGTGALRWSATIRGIRLCVHISRVE